MSEPLVSVIVPAYNRKELLKEALESIYRQTYTGFEVIVADDGSEDGTADMLEAFRRGLPPEAPELRILRLAHSGFPGEVRNRGVDAARGRYLAFLDCDDLWRPEKLERQLERFLSGPGLRIVHTRELWLRGEKTVSQKTQKHRREGDVFSDALEKCILGPSTVMMETALYRETGGFAGDLEIAEDYEYWLRITSRLPVGYVEEPLTVKRAGDWDQLSARYGQIEIFRIRALRNLVDRELLPPERRREAREVLGRKCGIYGRGCLKRDRREEGEAYLALAEEYGNS